MSIWLSLTTIKEVIQAFLERLNIQHDKLDLLEDDNLIEMADALTVSKNNLKEEKTISELGRASEKLERLTDSDVRIVYIPPMTVASCHDVGEEPEMRTGRIIREFVLNNNLVPASRICGTSVLTIPSTIRPVGTVMSAGYQFRTIWRFPPR